MTSGDEVISELVSDNEYSYEENEKKKRRVKKGLGHKDATLGKKKREENTDELISDDPEDNENSLNDHTDSNQYTSNSLAKRQRKRVRRKRGKHDSSDNVLDYIEDQASSEDEEAIEQDYSDDVEITPEQREEYTNQFTSSRANRGNDYFRRIQSEDPESLARYYDETTEYDDDLEGGKNMSLSLLPSLKDPKLFSVRCRIGSEREAAVCLMNKFFCLKGTKDEINIFSASALDKFPGYIFVEAHRDYHVKEAIKGIKILNMGKVKPIPVKEVTQVFSVDASKQLQVEPGQFARIKKGLYHGDLALIDCMDESGKSVKIKLVPRLTPGSADPVDESDRPGDENKKTNVLRPPKRVFSPDDFPEAKPLDTKKSGVQVFNYKGLRFENGLLVKKIYINNLDLKDVVPSLEEIQMFQMGETKKERKEQLMERAKKTIEESKLTLWNLQKGDKVKIVQGDLKGITGSVVEVTSEHIKVLPNIDIAKEPIVFLPSEITKLFQPGDNVEILSGKYKGITGTIAKVDGAVAHVISQDNKDDMEVLVSNIKYTSSVNATQRDASTLSLKLLNSRNNIQKHDLIILNDHKTVGVATSVLKDSVAFIDSEGFPRSVPKMTVMNKLNPQGHTKNSYNQDIYPKCIVRVNEGQQKGKSAVVKHVYNDTLFLYDQNLTQNSGIFVERVNNCYLLGSSVYDNTKMLARFNNPTLAKAQQEFSDATLPPSVISEKQQVKAKQDPKTRRINLIGQTKAIAKGAYKGFSGRISSLTGDMVKMELEAINRSISVPLEFLNIDQVEKESYSSNLLTGKTPIHRNANSPFYINTPAYNPD